MAYTAEYERGDYGTVRNAILRENASGDNYDFGGFQIYGIVCTPFVAFVHRQQTRVILTNSSRFLRAICSVDELIDFLNDEGE